MTPWTPKLRGLLVACLAALALSACALHDDVDPMAAAGVNCEQNSDCPSGQLCREGFCSVRSIDSHTLDFRFIPPSSSDFLPQRIERVDVEYDQRLGFGLARGITVSSGDGSDDTEGPGGLRYADANATRPTGTLVFRPKGVDDSLFIREAQVKSGDFAAQVTPGEYDLIFVPEDRAARPKTTWQDREFESNTILTRTIPPAIEVSGTLEREVFVGSSGSTGHEQLTKAQIYAVSADGKHTSSVVQTNEHGDFNLRVQRDTGWYHLHVVPASADVMMPTSVFEHHFKITSEGCLDASERELQGCALSNLTLGAYPAEPVGMTIKLEAAGESADASTWSATSVVVRGPLGNGTFRRKFSVDEDGRARLEVYPSTNALDELPSGYTIEVIPPSNSKLARSRFELDGKLSADSESVFTVDLKKPFSGQVVDSSGQSVGATRLEFRQFSGDDADAHDPSPITATTDADGRFDIWLESARYEVLVSPPTSSGQPRTLEQITRGEVDAGQPRRIELSQPGVVLGTVMGARDSQGDDLMGIGEVTVEAYKVVGGRTVVFGQSRTDSRGHFRMALPAGL